MLLYVHIDRCIRLRVPDFHTKLLSSVPESCFLKYCFTSTETVGLLGTEAQDGHLDFHTAPELCARFWWNKCPANLSRSPLRKRKTLSETDLFLLGTLEAGHARGGGQWSVCAVRADTGSGGPYAG